MDECVTRCNVLKPCESDNDGSAPCEMRRCIT